MKKTSFDTLSCGLAWRTRMVLVVMIRLLKNAEGGCIGMMIALLNPIMDSGFPCNLQAKTSVW